MLLLEKLKGKIGCHTGSNQFPHLNAVKLFVMELQSWVVTCVKMNCAVQPDMTSCTAFTSPNFRSGEVDGRVVCIVVM